MGARPRGSSSKPDVEMSGKIGASESFNTSLDQLVLVLILLVFSQSRFCRDFVVLSRLQLASRTGEKLTTCLHQHTHTQMGDVLKRLMERGFYHFLQQKI